MKSSLFFRLILFLVLHFTSSVYAQCTSCDIVNPVTFGNYTFPANRTVCFTQNTTLGDIILEDNAKICIAPNVTLTINTNTTTTAGYNNQIDVNGTLKFSNNPNFKSDIQLNIASTGLLENSAGFTITNSKTSIINNGTINLQNTINFAGASSVNYVENNGTINVSRFNSTNGATTVYNTGTIKLTNIIDNNASTLYINCGIIDSQSSINMGGSKIINTGIFTLAGGTNDFSGNSTIINFGVFNFYSIINGGTNASIYNEGLVRLSAANLNGLTLLGPKNSAKKGYFYVRQTINPNGAKVGPNLDFIKFYSFNPDDKSSSQGENQIFSNSPTYIDANNNTTTVAGANVTYDCAATNNCSAPMIVQINKCPDSFGNFPPDVTFCVKPASTKTGAKPSTVGISTYATNSNNFPSNIPNGYIALASKNKGLVITRVQNSAKIVDPKEGMIIYDINAKCTKLYNGTTWHCIVRSCNE